jgi:hypothetical protein
MDLEIIATDEVNWIPGSSGRFWYTQPTTVLPDAEPIVPQSVGQTPGLRLLGAALALEAQFSAPQRAPAFIIVPEFAIHPREAQMAIQLARQARPNTIVVFGLGHMTSAEADALEPGAVLWDGPSEGRLTNCAAIVFGGSGRVFLQPKIVRSRYEETNHWPGRVVRYFVGKNLQFVVVICSELLDRPEGATTAKAVVEALNEQGRQLNLVIWIQHNPRPRSAEFSASIAEFGKLRATTIVVGSRAERSPVRLNNFAVSGAFVPQQSLPRRFDLLTKRFHYIEPVSGGEGQSRVVLLRYDADAYRVQTTLAHWIEADDRAARGALFEEAKPYLLVGGVLVPSEANYHLEDVCARAAGLAAQGMPALVPSIERTVRDLCALTTTEFMAVLDVGVLPRPAAGSERHVAGVVHPNGDYLCRCWWHRECVDFMTDQDGMAEPIAHLILAMAALDAAGVQVRPRYVAGQRTNTVLACGGAQVSVGVVFPFQLNAEGTEEGLWGKDRAGLVDSCYIVLGVAERPEAPSMRPRVALIDAARPRPVGAVRQGMSGGPMLRAIYGAQFWRAQAEGRLRVMVEERFMAAEP